MSYSDHIFHRVVAAKRHLSLFDRIVIVVSFIYPLSASPQVVEVFAGNIAGVSLFSWVGFLVCATLFLAYGVKHKITPMIIANSLWVVMDSLVILGILMQR